MTNTKKTMIDMCRKFNTNISACVKGCCDQLCQMLRTGHAVLIKIFCHELRGYHFQFLGVAFLYYGGSGMRIEIFRDDCYDDSVDEV